MQLRVYVSQVSAEHGEKILLYPRIEGPWYVSGDVAVPTRMSAARVRRDAVLLRASA